MADNSGALPTSDGGAGNIDADEIDDYIVGGLGNVGYGTYSVDDTGEVRTTWTP